jgi:hypothetical protein
MSREKFIRAFSRALGANAIIINTEELFIEGDVIFKGGEKENIKWNISEKELPSEDCYQIIEFIADNQLLSIDKIILTKDELLKKINLAMIDKWNTDKFTQAYTEMINIRIERLEQGKKIDEFFIHT